MEELKYLSTKNNVPQMSVALQKIAREIRTEKASSSASSNVSNLKGVDFLKEKCFDDSIQLSQLAFQTFVRLVEDGTLDAAVVLSMFVSMLPGASKHQYTAVSEGVISLLLLDLKRRTMTQSSTDTNAGKAATEYVCPFGLRPPQHPLIMLFQKKDLNVLDLINKINGICCHHDKSIRQNSIEFLRPVFLYMLCNPVLTPDSKSLWTCLLAHCNKNARVQSLLHEVLAWCNISNGPNCLYASILLTECINALQLQNDQSESRLEFTIYLCNLLGDLIKWGYDPRPSILSVFNVIYVDLELACPYLNIALVALATILPTISPVYLADLLRLLRLIVVTADAGNRITLNMILDGLIIWIAHPLCVPDDSLGHLNSLVKHIKHKRTYTSVPLKPTLSVKYYHPNIALCLQVARLSELLAPHEIDRNAMDAFLTLLRSHRNAKFVERINTFVRGIFLLDYGAAETIDLLLDIVRNNQSVAVDLIRPWLYKFLNEKSPTNRLKLLKCLPIFAVVKENVPIILNTLQSISSRSLKPLALDLYLRLWKCEERTYMFLQNQLSASIDKHTSPWQINVAKAFTIKEICRTQPAKHGTDLVIHLSNILNECSKSDGETATVIALEAIICLCYSHTVNIASTWNALRVKFEHETRVRPLISLCEFFGKVPQLYSPTAEYEILLAESIAKLWHFVVYADDHRIKIAALNALQHFNFNTLSLADMPDDFRQNIALPTEFLKGLAEGEPAPEPIDVLTYVPSECWLQVLQFVNHSASEAASDLVAHHIRTEVAAFKSGVYTLPEGHPEPRHVNRLSRQSPLKAILKFLLAESHKTNVSSRNRHLTFFCLRSISLEFANPMPALQWSFLVEFMQPDEPEMTQFCLQILAKQMPCSASAVQTVESYVISAIDSRSEDDLLRSVELFARAAAWIADDLLYRWTEFILEYSVELSSSEPDADYLKNALENIAKLFANPMFNKTDHPLNYNVVLEVLSRFYERIAAKKPPAVWAAFQTVCRQLPRDEVDRISQAQCWTNLTGEQFMRLLSVRCDLVKHSSVDRGWLWLNAVVDNVDQSQINPLTVLESVSRRLGDYEQERDVCLWAMDLLSKIQSILSTDPLAAKKPGFLFLLDVFYMIVIVRSGFVCLTKQGAPVSRQELLDIFPEALYQLMTLDAWMDCEARVYEFFFNVFVNSTLNADYMESTRHVLMSFKTRPYFSQKSVWMKYVGLRL